MSHKKLSNTYVNKTGQVVKRPSAIQFILDFIGKMLPKSLQAMIISLIALLVMESLCVIGTVLTIEYNMAPGWIDLFLIGGVIIGMLIPTVIVSFAYSNHSEEIRAKKPTLEEMIF